MRPPTGIHAQLDSFKKDRIRDHAERLFYLHGFTGTSMDALAESLHATKPFVYGAYAKKTDILFDIHLCVVQRTAEALEAAHGAAGTPRDKLHLFGRLLTEVTLANHTAVAIFFREEVFIPPKQLRKINDLKGRIDDRLAALLQQGIDAGEFRIADVRMAALAIGGMISWAYTWYRADGRLSIADIGLHMADYALRIAGAAPPQP